MEGVDFPEGVLSSSGLERDSPSLGGTFCSLCRLERRAQSEIMVVRLMRAYRFPHGCLARRVSTKGPLVRWQVWEQALEPELFGEVTGVRACSRVRARILWVLRCCWDAPEAQSPYSAPAREVRKGKGMSANENTVMETKTHPQNIT